MMDHSKNLKEAYRELTEKLAQGGTIYLLRPIRTDYYEEELYSYRYCGITINGSHHCFAKQLDEMPTDAVTYGYILNGRAYPMYRHAFAAFNDRLGYGRKLAIYKVDNIKLSQLPNKGFRF